MTMILRTETRMYPGSHMSIETITPTRAVHSLSTTSQISRYPLCPFSEIALVEDATQLSRACQVLPRLQFQISLPYARTILSSYP
jgi:hypothetical protein